MSGAVDVERALDQALGRSSAASDRVFVATSLSPRAMTDRVLAARVEIAGGFAVGLMEGVRPLSGEAADAIRAPIATLAFHLRGGRADQGVALDALVAWGRAEGRVGERRDDHAAVIIEAAGRVWTGLFGPGGADEGAG